MVDARDIHAAVWDKLDAVAAVNTYDGEVPKTPPLDPDGRVHAYAVLYAGPGTLFASALDAAQGSLNSVFQVTCVGGDPTRLLWCVGKVRAGLIGAIDIGGIQRRIRAEEEDPGPGRRDDDVHPVRFYVPLFFRVIAS